MGVYITTETHRHDFNDELGDGKLFDGWDRVENKWEQYAHQVFGVEEESGDDTEDEGAIPRKPAKGKRCPRFDLPTDVDNMPYVPIILNMNTQDKKDVVCAFISFHYGMGNHSMDQTLTVS